MKLLFWALKTVATLAYFFTLFTEFITDCLPQVIGTQQVWDVTYCNPFPSEYCSTIHLHFLPSNPMILQVLTKHFLSMGEEEAKNKRQDCCVTFKPKN